MRAQVSATNVVAQVRDTVLCKHALAARLVFLLNQENGEGGRTSKCSAGSGTSAASGVDSGHAHVRGQARIPLFL